MYFLQVCFASLKGIIAQVFNNLQGNFNVRYDAQKRYIKKSNQSGKNTKFWNVYIVEKVHYKMVVMIAIMDSSIILYYHKSL